MSGKIKFGSVVSSRVRISRNIDGAILFPQIKSQKSRIAAKDKIVSVFKSIIDDGHNYTLMSLDGVDNVTRALFEEDGYIHPTSKDNPTENALFISVDGRLMCTTGYVDHFRTISIREGLSLKKCYKECMDLCDLINSKVKFATRRDPKTGEIDYVTGGVRDFGSGVMFSVRVNLTNIVRQERLIDLQQFLENKGVMLSSPFDILSTDDYPAGGFFDLYPLDAYARTPVAQIKILEDVCGYIDMMEGRIIDTMLPITKNITKNAILRAYYITRYSLFITEQEALDVLGDMRNAILMGYLKNVTYCELYSILQKIQSYHVYHLQNFDKKGKKKATFGFNYDTARAAILRDIFGKFSLDKSTMVLS